MFINLVINTVKEREVSVYGFILAETIRIFCGNIPAENLINNFVYNGVDFKLKYNVLKFFWWWRIDLLLEYEYEKYV